MSAYVKVQALLLNAVKKIKNVSVISTINSSEHCTNTGSLQLECSQIQNSQGLSHPQQDLMALSSVRARPECSSPDSQSSDFTYSQLYSQVRISRPKMSHSTQDRQRLSLFFFPTTGISLWSLHHVFSNISILVSIVHLWIYLFFENKTSEQALRI